MEKTIEINGTGTASQIAAELRKIAAEIDEKGLYANFDGNLKVKFACVSKNFGGGFIRQKPACELIK